MEMVLCRCLEFNEMHGFLLRMLSMSYNKISFGFDVYRDTVTGIVSSLINIVSLIRFGV